MQPILSEPRTQRSGVSGHQSAAYFTALRVRLERLLPTIKFYLSSQNADAIISLSLAVRARRKEGPAVKFHEMTFPQLRNVPRDRTVVVAPIAACEQHSRHLPTITDTVLVNGVAEGVEKRLPEQVLLLPALWFGASSHHLPFGATLSAEVDTHIQMLCDLLTPLLEDGYERILVLNGHGGNIDTMHVALRRLQPRFRKHILSAASYWELAENELAALAEGSLKSMGHACEFETSMMLALRPELVQREAIRDDPPHDDPTLRGLFLADDMRQKTDHGCVGYPERASADKGRALLAAAIDRTVEVIQALLKRPLPD